MFGKGTQSADKVNMSLDDIIKLNKKNNQQSHPNNKNSQQRTKNPKAWLNKPGQQQNRRQNNRPNINKQNKQQQKPFGLLNRSKTIQKKRGQSMNQRNQGQQNPRRAPVIAQMIAKRRRVPNNARNAPNRAANQFNRFGNNKPQLSTIKIIKPAANVTAKPQNNILKSPKKPTTPKRFKQAKEIRQSKIAMLSARKNVQKAKKLLIARKQPQLMTQRYASKLGLAAIVPNQRVKPVKPLQQRQLQQQQKQPKQTRPFNNNIAKRRLLQKKQQQRPLQQPKKRAGKVQESKAKMLTVSIANKQNNISRAKPAVPKQQQTKRPILNRTRAQGAPGITSSRMVFF